MIKIGLKKGSVPLSIKSKIEKLDNTFFCNFLLEFF